MESTNLVGVFCGAADPQNDLGSRDKRGDHILAPKPALLRNGKSRWKDCGARMHANARFGGPIELEGMRQTPVGKGGHGRLHKTPPRTEDPALAALPVGRRVVDDHSAPWQAISENHRTDRVAD